jgi:hypothetical protein
VAAFGGGADRVLVDGDAETGCRRAVDVAVAKREGCRVGQVVEMAAAVAVADAQYLFLHDEVGDGEVELEAGGEGDRAERAVRGHQDVARLCHRGDATGLGDAVGVADVGLATAMPSESTERKSQREQSRSPVAMGMEVERTTAPRSWENSSSTGSSTKSGRSGSRTWISPTPARSRY